MHGSRDPLETLVTPERADRLVHLATLPERAAATAAWPDWADPALVRAYAGRGIELPWTHQAEAARSLWEGRHTVLATSTGSGKSLAAWLPTISAVRRWEEQRGTRLSALTRRPTALYLSPTKALAADQVAGLRDLLAGADRSEVRAATCDGDTARDERDWVRNHADVVLTNPDFLHFSLLPGHRRWERFLRGLRFVVVDECHAYRGVFGAHVALVLRRTLRLARARGARPVVFLASATTGEPAEVAARLIGVAPGEVTAVTRDGSPAGRRRLAVWVPARLPGSVGPTPDGDPDAVPPARRSVLSETAELLADLVRDGSRALAFTRARAAAESVAGRARETLHEVDTALAEQVAAYRGGFLPEERRELEHGIRTGRLRGLATTNALELGIDLAGLDAVLIAGWPGSRASLWQQAGRSGRAGRDGLAVLVTGQDPLESYLRAHPDVILNGPPEASAFDPGNSYVLAPHLCAAAAESPIREEELSLFGLEDSALPAELARRGLLRRRSDGWYWNHARPEDPSQLTDLRGTGGAVQVQVVEAGTGRLLGTVDPGRAEATVHPGAVYVHQGRKFLIDALADGAAVGHADPDLTYRTLARSETHVSLLDRGRERAAGGVAWGYGDVEITSRVTGFAKLRVPSGENLGEQPLSMPEHRMRTRAVWWTLDADALTLAGIGPEHLAGALHAAEHAAIGLLPLVATCDPWDLGGISTALHADTLRPTVVVYDGFPGGAGFAERGFAAGWVWIAATRAAVSACPCRTGCPGCVQSPQCGSGNSPLEKGAAIRLLDALLAAEPWGRAPTEN